MNAVEVKDLSFTYPSAPTASLNDISFHIQGGEIFGFLGPNGAGKSTTQKLLTGQLALPSTGPAGNNHRPSIEVLNRPLADWGSDLYNQIGVGFELPNHYLKLTALENLNYFAAFYPRMDSSAGRLKSLLDRVGLAGAAGQRTGDFSKGMKMRLNFIRSIMHDPQLVFLDEPVSGLDPVNARIVKDEILQIKEEGRTVFLTTHNMHDAEQLCDRVAFIVDGRIAAIDSPASLKRQYGRRTVEVEYRTAESTSDRPARREFQLDDPAGQQALGDFIKTVQIETIHSREASLEDVFITVTGASLSADHDRTKTRLEHNPTPTTAPPITGPPADGQTSSRRAAT